MNEGTAKKGPQTRPSAYHLPEHHKLAVNLWQIVHKAYSAFPLFNFILVHTNWKTASTKNQGQMMASRRGPPSADPSESQQLTATRSSAEKAQRRRMSVAKDHLLLERHPMFHRPCAPPTTAQCGAACVARHWDTRRILVAGLRSQRLDRWDVSCGAPP